MIKRITLFLVLFLLCFSFVACSSPVSVVVPSDVSTASPTMEPVVIEMTPDLIQAMVLEAPPTAAPTPAPKHIYTQEEIIEIAEVVHSEAGGEDFKGEVMVASVILNRFESGYYGQTVIETMSAPDQFAYGKHFYDRQSLGATEYAIAHRNEYPSNMFYFRMSEDKQWYDHIFYTRYGCHTFYLSSHWFGFEWID